MANSGEEYEGYVQFVYNMLLNTRANNISVARRMDVLGRHGEHFNIDVYYQFVQANVTHRVAIECKDTKRPIGRDAALTFVGKLDDMPGTVGVFISKSGFQSGALQTLQNHGVVALSDEDLPRFNQVIAQRLENAWLPDSTVVGEPFWALMRVTAEGQNTGTYFDIPSGMKFPRTLIALFFSRSHALSWLQQNQLAQDNKFAVRGLSRLSLDVLIETATLDETVGFVTLLDPGTRDPATPWSHRVYAPSELAADF